MKKTLTLIALFVATVNSAHASYMPCYSRSCHELRGNFYLVCFLGFIAYLLIKKFLLESTETKTKSDTTQNPETAKTHNHASPTATPKSQQAKADQPSDLSHKKAGIMAAIAGGKLSYEQACAIEKHQNAYNFNSEEIIAIRKITGSHKTMSEK